MKKFRALIADSNPYFIKLFQDYIERMDIFEEYDITRDGIEAMSIIYRKKPDLVLTALMLERLDALGLIENICTTLKLARPKIVVVSNIVYPKMVELALDSGANLYLSKNVEYDVFESKLKELMYSPTFTQKRRRAIHSERDVLMRITRELQLIGVPPASLGFKYVRVAIQLALEDEDTLNNLMSQSYPVIAERYHTNIYCVERNIRHALECAWTRGNMNRIDEVFAYSIDAERGRPTNRAFIATIADRIRLTTFF